jgi:hypothetical protein
VASRDRPLTQLSDAELEQRFVEAERIALEWSGQAIGRHAEHQATRWMQLVADCRAEIARRAAGGAIERSPIEQLVGELARMPGVVMRRQAFVETIAAISARYILPLDYIEFLRLADGAAGCFGNSGELRSAAALANDKPHPNHGNRFVVIARAGRNHAAVFDTAIVDDDREPVIVETNRGTATRHRRFIDFLATLVERLRR